MSIWRGRAFLLFVGVIALAISNSAAKIRDPFEEAKNDVEMKQRIQHALLPSSMLRQTGSLATTNNQKWTNVADSSEEDELDLGNYNSGASERPKHCSVGNYLSLNQQGIHLQVVSPNSPQKVAIWNGKVFVNNRVVCNNMRGLKAEKTYQKGKDGSMWFTNLKVGRKMTRKEINTFKIEAEAIEVHIIGTKIGGETGTEMEISSSEQDSEEISSDREAALAEAARQREDIKKLREQALEEIQKQKEAELEEIARQRKAVYKLREVALQEANEVRQAASQETHRQIDNVQKLKEEALVQTNKLRETALQETAKQRENMKKLRDEALVQANKVRKAAFKETAKQRENMQKLREEALDQANKVREAALEEARKIREAALKQAAKNRDLGGDTYPF